MQNMQKNSNFKVGIIAPIFSENYKDFLDSITAQNYKNLSILLLTNSDSIDILCYLEKYLRDNRFMLLKSDFKDITEARNMAISFYANNFSFDNNANAYTGGGGDTSLNTNIDSNLPNIESKFHIFSLTFNNKKAQIFTTSAHLQIPKIDYIYFADSNICLFDYCIESILNHIDKTKQIPRLIYFKIFDKFKDIDSKDYIESFFYYKAINITAYTLFTRFISLNAKNFEFDADILINFSFLRQSNIRFLAQNGYNKAFSIALLLRSAINASENIYILPLNLAYKAKNISQTQSLTPKDYLNLAIYLNNLCQDINIESSLLPYIIHHTKAVFIRHYYTNALNLLDQKIDSDTISKLQNLNKSLSNIESLGADEIIKNSLDYKLGKLILESKKTKKALALPFRLFKEIRFYKHTQKALKMRYKKYPFATPLDLVQYADYETHKELYKSREYILGSIALKAHKYALLGSYVILPFILIFKARNIKKAARKQRNEINEFILNKVDSKAKKLIINFGDIGIGDYLALRVMLKEVRRYYSGYEITFLGSYKFKDISMLYDKDFIDIYICAKIKNQPNLAYDYKAFFATRFYNIMLYPHDNTNTFDFTLSHIIKAALKITTYSTTAFRSKSQQEYESLRFDKIIYQSESDMFEILRMKEFFEILFNKPLPTPNIALRLESNAFSSIDFDFSQKYAVIFPTSTQIERMWDIYNFKVTSDYLYKKYGIITFILGTSKDNELASKIINDTHIFSLCGRYSLIEILYILNKSKIILVNDSGGYHLSLCVSDNIIVISFGSFVRMVNYPHEFIESKNVRMALSSHRFEYKNNGEYSHSHSILNSILPTDIYPLIDSLL